METLRSGEAAFFLESPLVATAEEAAAMAKIAAEKMAPAPGNVMLTFVLQIIGGPDLDLDAVDQIAAQIVESFSENWVCFCGSRFCDGQKGIRFVLATSEGRADAMEETL